MMDNIPNLRLEVLIDYVLTKRNVCIVYSINITSSRMRIIRDLTKDCILVQNQQ